MNEILYFAYNCFSFLETLIVFTLYFPPHKNMTSIRLLLFSVKSDFSHLNDVCNVTSALQMMQLIYSINTSRSSVVNACSLAHAFENHLLYFKDDLTG